MKTLLSRLLLCLSFPCSIALAEVEPSPQRVLKLTLATALQRALAQNFSIKVDEYLPQISREAVRAELGRFDPIWDARADRFDESARDIFLNGVLFGSTGVNRQDRLSTGLRGVTAWGTEYDLRVGSVVQTGSVARDFFRSTGDLQLTQPLLRGAGPTVALANVRIARRGLKISEWQLRSRIIEILNSTNRAYNELQFSIEDLRVSIRSRELALQLFKDNEARVAIGVKSPLDVTQARAQVAAREGDVIRRQRTVLDNENNLKRLVTNGMMEILGTKVEIEPPPQSAFQPDVPAAVSDALELRPDYRQAILELEQQKIRVAVQKNGLLPRVDLVGSLSLLGLENEFAASFERLSERDQLGWSAGVVVSVPLGNRAARGAYNQAKLSAARQLANLQSLEQLIIVQVDNASGQIVAARERITAAREARRLARESLDAGEERLRAGTATTFEVLELQKILAEAEVNELRAISDYNEAIGEFQRTTGTMLRENQVSLD